MQSALAKCLAWLSPKGGDAAPPPPAQADGESKKPEKSWLATCHKSLASVKYLGFFFLISNYFSKRKTTFYCNRFPKLKLDNGNGNCNCYHDGQCLFFFYFHFFCCTSFFDSKIGTK